MNRNVSHPMILPMPTHDETPTMLPFPRSRNSRRRTPAAPGRDAREADLCEVRDRLFRMIVTNEWDRSHGNRAS